MTTATVDFVFVESKIRKWQWVKKLLLSAILKEFKLTINIGANETAVCDCLFCVLWLVLSVLSGLGCVIFLFFLRGPNKKSCIGVMHEGVMYITFSA